MILKWTIIDTITSIFIFVGLIYPERSIFAVKTSEGYLAKEIIIDRPSLQHVNSGLVDGIWLKAKSGGIPESKGFVCEDFNAELPGGISLSSRQQCECTLEASTFSFFDGEWKCVDNEEFRESEDCGFHFSSESEEDDPLRILKEDDAKAIILPSKNCSINATSSMYLDCGKWLPIDETSVLNKFSLNQPFMNRQYLKVHSENVSSFLNGHVIKLGLTCLPSNGEPCLVFKLNGSVSCQFYHKRTRSSTSLAISTSLQGASSSLKEIQTTPSYKPPQTHSLSLAWESSSYTPTRSVSLTSTTPVVRETPSFKPTQTVPVSATPVFQEAATISKEGLSLIASLSATTVFQPQTSSNFIQSTPILGGKEPSILRGKADSTQFASSLRMTSRSVLHSTNTRITFNSVFAKESIGMNHTASIDGNQKAMIDKKMSPKMSRLMLTAVIPGIMAGVFIILVSVFLCFLARRMGHLIRVGADRDQDEEDEVRSFSEEATMHGSDENLSAYELVERGNPSGVNENQASVTNAVYQKDDHIVFHGPPNSAKTPDGAEAIYAEPFGHIGGKNVQSAALTPLENAPGYQNLQGKKLESVEYASRYNVPQAESLQVPSHDGPDQAMQNGSNSCAGRPSSRNGDTLPNMERKEKYELRDILVEDLDIETSEAHEDLFEEMCVRPSLLVEDKTTYQSQDCACDNNPESPITENSCSTTKLNERPQTSKRQIETLERHPCMANEASKVNKTKAGSLKKFKTFFKLTL